MQYTPAISLIFHVVFCYLLTFKLDLGVAGVSIATLLTLSLNNLLIVMYTWKVSEYHISPFIEDPRSLLSKSEVMNYIRIGIPSVIMTMAEWSAAEILIIMAASISVGAVGAMSICYNFYGLLYYFPYGFQNGVVAVIGNYIGMEDERKGKLVFIIATIYSLTTTIGLSLFSYTYSYEIAATYTQDMDTVALLKGCIQSMCVLLSVLGITLSMQGTLRALQLQKPAS